MQKESLQSHNQVDGTGIPCGHAGSFIAEARDFDAADDMCEARNDMFLRKTDFGAYPGSVDDK